MPSASSFFGPGETWLLFGTALVIAATWHMMYIEQNPLPFPGNTRPQ
jgi:hypothetical protein